MTATTLDAVLIFTVVFTATLALGYTVIWFSRKQKAKRIQLQLSALESQAPPQRNAPIPMGYSVGGRGMLRRVFGDLRPYLWPIVGLSAISLAAIPITLITPLPLKLIVDTVLGSTPLPGFLSLLAPGGLQTSKEYVLWLSISILLASTVLTYLQSLLSIWFSTKIGNRMTMDVRARLFRQMQRLSIVYHDTKGTADSTYRTLNDAPMLKAFGIDTLIPLVTSILTLGAMIIVTLYIDAELALIALLVSPVMFLLTLAFRPRIRAGWRKFKTQESAAMAMAQETLGASRVVKAFGQEEQRSEQVVHHYNESLSAQLKVNVDSALYNLLVGIVIATGIAAVLYVGVIHVESKTNPLLLGNLLIVNYYITQLYTPLKNVGQKILDVQMALAGIERYHTVLDEKPDVPESQNALPLLRADGRIAFRNVSFEYIGGHKVLRNVSFDLLPGNCLGIVGQTGSGKTTISSLLLRFFDPREGLVTLDEVDLRDYKVADLRNQFAVVHQDTVLFSTTIAENIRFAKPDATIEEVVTAAKAANAHDFIVSLPGGYNTLVGERGMKLSGGERQRISLARAFLKDAPILVLDEPTSALDVRTETAVLHTIQRLMQGKTTLMIAHRPSSLRNCNLILLMEDGRVSRVTTDVDSILSEMSAVAIPGFRQKTVKREATP